ncbi:MAG: glycosyltransferase [Muribaculaceae bacterium]|nr:glycosyltransferase [Muribaculaceae bacterium]
MKVLHVISAMHHGGAQQMLCDLLPALKCEGIDAELLVFRELHNSLEQRLINDGIRIHSLNLPERSPAVWKAFRSFMKSHSDIDVVHVHLFPALYQVAISMGRNEIPLVYTEHSVSNGRRLLPWGRGIERWIYGHYSRVIAVSDNVKESLSEWLATGITGPGAYSERDSGKNSGRKSNFIQVIENGIDLNRFHPKERKDSVVAPKILMAARFADAKDHHTLLKSFSMLRNREAELWLAGDGPKIDEVKAYADRLGVKDRCRFLGHVNDIERVIEKVDIGVLSSHWEGYSISVAECMAGGLPMVGSDISGIRVVGGDAMEYFPAGDEKKLCEILHRLMSDREYYNRHSISSLSRSKELSITNTAFRYNRLYTTLRDSGESGRSV